jgi:hypothetical protein
MVCQAVPVACSMVCQAVPVACSMVCQAVPVACSRVCQAVQLQVLRYVPVTFNLKVRLKNHSNNLLQ